MIFDQPVFSVPPISDTPDENSPFFFFQNNRLLLRQTEDGWTWPVLSEVQEWLPDDFEPFQLFCADGVSFFSAHPYSDLFPPETDGFTYQPVGVMRSLPHSKATTIMTGWHLWSWYQQNRFCGCCGKSNMPDTKERALRCTACDHLRFPMIAPAVMVAITCGDRILLAKSLNSPTGRYGLIAGYVEVGETLEHAAHREVMEEAGIRLKSLSYIGDQPWGISGSHMFAFKAEADDTQPIHVQETELADARWFDRDALPPRAPAVSIAHELIERFRAGNL